MKPRLSPLLLIFSVPVFASPAFRPLSILFQESVKLSAATDSVKIQFKVPMNCNVSPDNMFVSIFDSYENQLVRNVDVYMSSDDTACTIGAHTKSVVVEIPYGPLTGHKAVRVGPGLGTLLRVP